ncbi:DNA sulfur modification protein DndE [Enterobacter hormaechei]|uniref:DNA sulfur modification protein DndE n=1 Tax=Enterobacter hormaechei TaxID=158836 RepID=UPI00053888AD|nr:DNA sulfur modification protein DndE [Enterobacter hormaechei]KLP87792.1 DNA sulfur modification protein DndE [Enterobacter hormaechei subsp. steigerwaltii]MCC9328427.1 DNA sulfur modification protein DndE [Enterobacter hormaechei subsp. steigerwaltii]MCC9333937.1 DNA sulfur modification protein DndE [Enterobacter hormaechei subsp. steigerwaltii]MCC9342606.1 DNA sulfur modification protein DndE [Enterobacter hormaechei subsp. steigerwaltii]MCC9349683.1 DNA sulfur modification protein DndE [
MTIEIIRVSEKAKQQLITLKKRTGIDHWNILCRWAFCLSLAEESIPPHEDIITNSNIEMTWKTFGGDFSDVYMVMLRQRTFQDFNNLDDDTLNQSFKLHLHRGISYLLNKVYSLDDITKL